MQLSTLSLYIYITFINYLIQRTCIQSYMYSIIHTVSKFFLTCSSLKYRQVYDSDHRLGHISLYKPKDLKPSRFQEIGMTCHARDFGTPRALHQG